MAVNWNTLLASPACQDVHRQVDLPALLKMESIFQKILSQIQALLQKEEFL